MSLSTVRTFLNQQIALANPSLKEWRDSFNNENLPQTKLETYYHIEFGTLTSDQNDNWILDEWNLNIILWKRGFNKPVDAFDSVIDSANAIRLKIIDPRSILTDNILQSVQSVSITPEAIAEDNDNTIKVNLEFNCILTCKTV